MFENMGSNGHVAYVEEVSGGSFRISEMWWPSGCDNQCCKVCSYRWYSSASCFILPPGGTCSAPTLNEPGDGHVSSSRSITFRWSAPGNCTPDGYTFRVKTVSDMDSGGETIFDEGQGGTQVTKDFGSQWDNRDLYWSVRACKPCTPYNPGPWAPSRRFRIAPGSPPPPSCNPDANQVALFVDANYSGQCVVKGIGQYSNPSSIGLPNDSISSVKVGSNVKAILCEHDNYQGTCEAFTGDDANLADNSIGNDRVSSAKVEPRASPPSAPQLLSPANGSTFNEGDSITLSWSAQATSTTVRFLGGLVAPLPLAGRAGRPRPLGANGPATSTPGASRPATALARAAGATPGPSR